MGSLDTCGQWRDPAGGIALAAAPWSPMAPSTFWMNVTATARDGASWADHARLGTICLLTADPEGARAAFERALAARPEHRGAALGRVEAMLDAGDAAGAREAVESLLGDEPDGWLLAALAMDALGALAEMKSLLFQCRARVVSGTGFLAPHRRERLATLSTALSAYLGRPVPGAGTVGAMAALLAGAPVPQSQEGHVPDPLAAVRFAMNLVRVGRGLALGRLVGPRAESVLPGIGALIRQVARVVDVPLPSGDTPTPVWIEAPPGSSRTLLEALLGAHPGLCVMPDRLPGVRVVRLVADGMPTPVGAPSVTTRRLLQAPELEVERLTAALSVARAPAMLRVLAAHAADSLRRAPTLRLDYVRGGRGGAPRSTLPAGPVL